MNAIQKEPIKKQAADYIRNLIFKGELKSGDHIVTSDFAALLDVGRGVIREALFDLENEGLISNHPYKGCFVRAVSRQELEEIGEIRSFLEAYAIKVLGNTITEEDLDLLNDICVRMETSSKYNRYDDFAALDKEFHGYFVKKADRGALYDTWDSCSAKLSLFIFSHVSRRHTIAGSADRHRKIVEAIRKDPSSAYGVLRHHYSLSEDYEEDND